MKINPIQLAYGEQVIAVVPEYASGPGWSNTPLWVHISGGQGGNKLRSVCIQPEQQTAEMHALFGPCAAMHKAMIRVIPTKRSKHDHP